MAANEFGRRVLWQAGPPIGAKDTNQQGSKQTKYDQRSIPGTFGHERIGAFHSVVAKLVVTIRET
jgi:hypothetical protein